MSSPVINHNLNNVVYLRAIAALMVLLCHYISSHNSFSGTAIFLTSFGQLGVHIFFVVSGFVIPIQLHRRSYTYDDLFKFFLNRIARIYPCFLVVLCGATLVWQIQYLVAGGIGPDLSFSNILKNIFLVFDVFDGTTYLGVAWTLAIEFSYYLVLALLFPLLFTKGPNWYLLICLCLLGVSFIGGAESQRINFLKWAPFFVCGFSIYRAKYAE